MYSLSVIASDVRLLLCNLLWLDNALVKIHDWLGVAHTCRNCRDHSWLTECRKLRVVDVIVER